MADITLPQLGETVTEGTITRWFKKVGDTVAADEPLFEVSTDKVDTEVPSPSAGVLTEIRAQEGDTVPVGAVIAVVGATADAPATAPGPEPVAAAAPASQPEPESPPEPVSVAAAPATTPVPGDPDQAPQPSSGVEDNRLLSPVVRRLVAEHDIDTRQLVGTGLGGRITREDVLDYIDSKANGVAAPAPAAPASAAPAPAPAPEPEPAPAPVAPIPAPAPAPAPAAIAPVAAPARAQSGERDEVVKLSKIRKLTGAAPSDSPSAPNTLCVPCCTTCASSCASSFWPLVVDGTNWLAPKTTSRPTV